MAGQTLRRLFSESSFLTAERIEKTCIILRAAVGNFRPGSGETDQNERANQNEGADRASQGTLATLLQDAETDRLLVKDDPAAGNLPSQENFVYMQESGGITVTAANVYHNGYTLYMTVTVRGEDLSTGCP